jgi:adenine-specific DNA-methyltransferase
MELNKEDGGNRQCIMVNINENNICEEVTYERNKKIIQGYSNLKGVQVEGLSKNNFRYYKSEFVSREPSIKNKRQLTQMATELLCIKEDCYTEIEVPFKNAKHFKNPSLNLLILFDDQAIPEAIVWLKESKELNFKVYVFSMGSDPYTEDFLEVADKVELCALPDAIYKAYQHVLPKKKKKVLFNEEDMIQPQTLNAL